MGSLSLDLTIKMKTLLILATFLSLAFGHSTESFLKARLMKGYDCCTLPEGQTKVTIGFRPVDIGFCAHKQMLILNTWNTYRWTDARLSWDPAHYDNITELRFPHNKIWIPDLTVYNLKAKVEHLVDYQAIVYSTGMVLIVHQKFIRSIANQTMTIFLSEFKNVPSKLEVGITAKVAWIWNTRKVTKWNMITSTIKWKLPTWTFPIKRNTMTVALMKLIPV